jgi:hypothetical protein
MRLAVKKVQIEDAAKLQTLVAEHIDSIEPGLVVLDSRLLLGQATVDVVGLDAQGALVLIVTGLTANEEMLLKAVEAYSWCLEYPESLERLYPSCVLSEERPPRLLFVVERMPDAFHRKIKQLGFSEVDCVEFRLLDVDGVPTAYFEPILKLRRAAPVERAPRVETPAPDAAPAASDKVIAFNGAAAARATSLKLQKLLSQAVVEAAVAELRTSERPAAPPREPAAVVSLVSRQQAVAAARPERVQPAPEPIVLRDPEPIIRVPEPVVAPAPEPIVIPTPIVLPTPELVVAPAAAPVVVREPEPLVVPAAGSPVVVHEPAPVAATADRALFDQLERAMAALELETEAAPASVTEPEVSALVVETEPEPTLEPAPEVRSVRAAAAPVVTPAAVDAAERVSFKDLAAALLGTLAPVEEVQAAAEPSLEELAQRAAEELEAAEAVTTDEVAEAEETDLALTVEALIQSVTPEAVEPEPVAPAPIVEAAPVVEAPLPTRAPVAPAAVAPAVEPPAAPKAGEKAAALPQGFEGLQFPNDGVLTRQWMEFLGQMSSTKA